MMKRDSTSEEKLLQLIRRKPALKSPGKKAEQKTAETTAVPPGKDVFALSEKNVFGFLNLGTRALVMASVGLVIFSAVQFFFIKDRRALPVGTEEVAETAQETAPFILPPQPAFSSYAEVFAQRDLFGNPGSVAQVDEVKNEAILPSPARDLSQDYKLVGILLDKNPTAVIENLQDGHTLFLPQGGNLDNGVLEQIEEGRVIINFDGQRLELRQ
jgi:hypothetical protein